MKETGTEKSREGKENGERKVVGRKEGNKG